MRSELGRFIGAQRKLHGALFSVIAFEHSFVPFEGLPMIAVPGEKYFLARQPPAL